MAFDELRLPEDIAEGAVGGPTFNTTIVTASASEQRIGLWDNAKMTWQISHAPKAPDQMAALIAFFRARKGKQRGFRFLDWTDYKAVSEVLQNSGTTTLLLTKTYTSGASSEVRRIVKPVAGTVTLYKDGVAMSSGYTLDTTTGTVTLSAAAAGSVFTWSGQFDVPVRFDTDSMSFSNDSVGMLSWERIPIIELHPDTFNAS